MLNKIILMGRLTRDPELRSTQSGISVTSFSLAVERDFGRGEDRQTDFFDIVAWRGTAEFVHKYFRKGQLVAVEGRLQTRKWDDRDGNKRISYEVVADNVYFAERKSDSPAPPADYGEPPPPKQNGAAEPLPFDANAPSSFAALEDNDDELPF